MAINLHTATVYDVKLTSAIAYGSDAQEAFYYIFARWDISTNIDDEYHAEYEMNRDELKHLRDDILNQTEHFKENEAYLKEKLSKANMTIDEFVEVLNKLITTSDQRNDYVLLSWY